jgi:hypothetical protein
MTDRFHVRPSTVVPGRWLVVDATSGRLVRKPKHASFSREDAETLAGRMNRQAARNFNCQRCHHRRPAAGSVGRICADCLQEPA